MTHCDIAISVGICATVASMGNPVLKKSNFCGHSLETFNCAVFLYLLQNMAVLFPYITKPKCEIYQRFSCFLTSC